MVKCFKGNLSWRSVLELSCFLSCLSDLISLALKPKHPRRVDQSPVWIQCCGTSDSVPGCLQGRRGPSVVVGTTTIAFQLGQIFNSTVALQKGALSCSLLCELLLYPGIGEMINSLYQREQESENFADVAWGHRVLSAVLEQSLGLGWLCYTGACSTMFLILLNSCSQRSRRQRSTHNVMLATIQKTQNNLNDNKGLVKKTIHSIQSQC